MSNDPLLKPGQGRTVDDLKEHAFLFGLSMLILVPTFVVVIGCAVWFSI